MLNSDIQNACRLFSKKYIDPNVRRWDDDECFSDDIFGQLNEFGIFAMLIPSEFGGSNLPYKDYITAIIEISISCGSLGLALAAHNSLCSTHINKFGNYDQKSKYLSLLTSKNAVGAWALTEPNSGSDSGSLQTTAYKENEYWVLNGSKIFITHGGSAEVFVVLARTGGLNEKHNITAFIVEKGTSGFTSGPDLKKLGMKACGTTALYFDHCKIPDENIIGSIGEGFKQAMHILDGGRLSIAALSIGIAQGAYQTALEYAQQRKQFGSFIASFQSIGFKLADMATKIHAATVMLEHAIEQKAKGIEIIKESAMVKLYSSEMAVEVCNEAVQILGGYGYMKDYLVEKHYRDAKLCTIGEGTSEIQRMIISRKLLEQ